MPISSQQKATRFKFADLILDVERGELYRADEIISLPKLSYDLLVALVESSPALLDADTLMALVWPNKVIGDETLKQRVKLLRKSIGDSASSSIYIESVRGRGYRLIPQVTHECLVKRAPAVMLDLSANDAFPSLVGGQFNRAWRYISYIGTAILSLLLAIFLLNGAATNQKSTNLASHTKEITEPKFENITTLDNKTKQAETYYRSAIEYYEKYRKVDNDIAQDLLKQSIILAPNMGKAYAALSRTYSQSYFQFNGEKSDKQLAIDNAYLAMTHGESTALSYSALGTAYYVSGWLSKSINAHLRAFEKDQSNILVATNLSFIYSEQGNLEQAFKWHDISLNLNPNYHVAIFHKALSLQRKGQLERAKATYLQSLEIKPDYLLAIHHLTQLYLQLGEDKQAQLLLFNSMDKYKNALILQHSLLRLHIIQGEYEKAKRLIETLKAKSVHQVNLIKTMRFLLNESVNDEAINKLIFELKASLKQGDEHPETSYLLGLLYAKLENEQLAYRYFIQSVEQGNKSAFSFDIVEKLDLMEDKSKFKIFLGRLD